MNQNQTIQAKVTHRFSASPEKVFDAWLDPQSARRWLKAALVAMGLAGDIRQVRVEARKGGKFFFSDMRDGGEARHWGTYLELDRPRKVVFTWITDESEEANPSTVTLTLEPDGQGCLATLVHEMDAAWADYVPRVEKGWGAMLGAVGALLER